ncbi:MAG: hypothetical protein H6953_15175 [Chromatiaceae bacterium]|nr:hypothetical protein [Chromatiaceae bacterium]MCP5421717.1 hypothetical protein [Chromatiaceae bacterium]
MFGFGKKKRLRKMDGLSSLAQMAVYLSQKEKNEASMESEKASLFAAAVSNYLFGRSMDEIHIAQFGIDEIEAAGNELIRSDSGIRKLVVQSLRVISTISIAAGKEAVGSNILSVYGGEYPESPDPGTFSDIVQSSIQGMSPYVQQSISSIQQ